MPVKYELLCCIAISSMLLPYICGTTHTTRRTDQFFVMVAAVTAVLDVVHVATCLLAQ